MMIVRPTSDRAKTVKAARLKSRSLLASIQERRRRGCSNSHSLVREYLSNFRVKLLGLDGAYRRLGIKRSIPLVAAAAAIDMHAQSTEGIAFHLKPKSSGGMRPVFSYGPEMVARQFVMHDLLRALFDLPPWQYNQRGFGRGRAVRDIRAAINEGFVFFGSLDISDCYSSFNSERIIQLLRLPEDIVRFNLLVPDIRHVGVGSIRRTAIHRDLRPLPSGGLPQGSVTSSYVSAFLLSDLMDYLPPSTKIFMYEDDILVLAETQAKIDAATTALRDGLHNHRSGGLRLKRCFSGDARETTFGFLGYKIGSDGTTAQVTLSDDRQHEIECEWWHCVQEDVSNLDDNVSATRRLLDRRLIGFQEADPQVKDTFIDMARELVNLERKVVGVPQIELQPEKRKKRVPRRKPVSVG